MARRGGEVVMFVVWVHLGALARLYCTKKASSRAGAFLPVGRAIQRERELLENERPSLKSTMRLSSNSTLNQSLGEHCGACEQPGEHGVEGSTSWRHTSPSPTWWFCTPVASCATP